MIISMILLSIITIIITTFIIIFQYRHYKAIENLRKRNIPIGKQPSFFNAILNQIRIELVTNENVKKIGKIYGWEMFGGINLTVAEPDLIQQILNKEFQNFPNRRKLNTDDPFFSNFLSTVELEQWKRIRSIVAPTFATGKLKRMKPCMDSICQTLITNIGNGIDETLKNNVDNNKEMNILNIKRYAGAFTMDTVLQVAFGCKIDSLIEPNNQVILMAKKLFSTDLTVKNLIAFLFTFFLPPIFSKIFHIRINGDVTDFFAQFASDIIEQKRQEFAAKDFSKASTFIEFLLEAEHELHQRRSNSIESYNAIDLNNNDNDDKMNDSENTNDQNNNDNNNNVNVDDKKLIKYMTNDEIMAQCVLFFLAGYDTTATTITMALYYLSLNHECQEIAFEEIETVLRSKSNDADDNNSNDDDDDGKKSLESLTFDEINTKFEYINGIVNETLRMTPPAPFTERRCMKDIELSTNDGKTVVKFEKDDIIQIPIWNLHYDNDYFPDSEKFEPKRFTHDYEHRYPSYAYLPFGSGPRACVAKSLALIEAKLALIWLIKHFKFDKCSKTKIPVEFYNQGGLLSPRDIYLKVERR